MEHRTVEEHVAGIRTAVDAFVRSAAAAGLIADEVDRFQRLVDDLIELARSDQPIERSAVDVAEVALGTAAIPPATTLQITAIRATRRARLAFGFMGSRSIPTGRESDRSRAAGTIGRHDAVDLV